MSLTGSTTPNLPLYGGSSCYASLVDGNCLPFPLFCCSRPDCLSALSEMPVRRSPLFMGLTQPCLRFLTLWL